MTQFDPRAIRACLLARREPKTNGDHDLNPGLPGPWPDGVRPLRAAAVLVPLVDRPGGPGLLLTERSSALRNHSGQVSFPGGRIEPSDASPAAAALREAYEEIGLHPDFVEILGELDPYETATGFRITPVVGLVRAGFSLIADPNEVAEIFEVPLAFVFDPANHETHSREWQGHDRQYYAMTWQGHYIWGATAGMLVNFSRRLGLASDPVTSEGIAAC